MKTVAGIFPTMLEAHNVMRELEGIGIPENALSIVAGNESDRHKEYLEKAQKASESTTAAAASGASFGGGMGIVATLVALSIPGVGPFIAAGAMATVLAGLGIGAVSGGLIAAFHHMGISHEEAPLYEEAVRRGSIMLIAKVDDTAEPQVTDLMRRGGARDLRQEADTWRESGWKGPQTDPHPYVLDDSIRAHEMSEIVKTPSSDQ
jgi:uncharacterized membrane protein